MAHFDFLLRKGVKITNLHVVDQTNSAQASYEVTQMLRTLSLGGEASLLILLPVPGDTRPGWPDSQR